MRNRNAQSARMDRDISEAERRRIAWGIAKVLTNCWHYRNDLAQAGVIRASQSIGDRPVSSGLLSLVMFRGMLQQMREDRTDKKRGRTLPTCSLEGNKQIFEGLVAPDMMKDVEDAMATADFFRRVREKASPAEWEMVAAMVGGELSQSEAAESIGLLPNTGSMRLRSLRRKVKAEYAAYREAIAR